MLQETRKDLLLVRALLDEVIPFMEAHPELVDVYEPRVEYACKCLGGWAATFQVCGLTRYSEILHALKRITTSENSCMILGGGSTLAERKACLEQLYERLVAA